MESRLRASPEQFAALIEFMERHGDLSRPQPGPQGRISGDRLWLELSGLLNSVGGGVNKSTDKGKKVWADWKTKTKKKYLGIRTHASGTGGGPHSRQTLTALEERVVAVIGVSAVVGQAGIQEQGFSRIDAPVQELVSEMELVSEVPLSQYNLSIPTSSPAAGRAPSPPPARAGPTTPPQPPTTPRARSQNAARRQASVSPRSTPYIGSPRRSLLRARINRGLTPFEQAASEFVAVEQRRLEHEEARDRRLHEREMERLRLESLRIEVAREHNTLLRTLSMLGQHLIDVLTQQQQSVSLPSTDILPDTE